MQIFGNGAVIHIGSYVEQTCCCHQHRGGSSTEGTSHPQKPSALKANDEQESKAAGLEAAPTAHTTALLRILETAKREFWATYDPPNYTTAPKSKDVSAWLKQQGVSKRIAWAMTTILRADDLPPGPRA